MTKEEILEKAIEKAQGNGWNRFESTYASNDPTGQDTINRMPIMGFIFSHDFAKAFWGERELYNKGSGEIAWKHYLQQMVLEEDPISYLEQFLKEEQ